MAAKRKKKVARRTQVFVCVRCTRELYLQDSPDEAERLREARIVEQDGYEHNGFNCWWCYTHVYMPWLAEHDQEAFAEQFEDQTEEDQDVIAGRLE